MAQPTSNRKSQRTRVHLFRVLVKICLHPPGELLFGLFYQFLVLAMATKMFAANCISVTGELRWTMSFRWFFGGLFCIRILRVLECFRFIQRTGACFDSLIECIKLSWVYTYLWWLWFCVKAHLYVRTQHFAKHCCVKCYVKLPIS